MLLLRLAVSSLSPNASRRIRPSSFTEPAHVSETDFRRPTRGAGARVGSLQQKAAGGLTSPADFPPIPCRGSGRYGRPVPESARGAIGMADLDPMAGYRLSRGPLEVQPTGCKSEL
jgi:hypothetical protein